ncbi:MAG: GtrA family protein [Ferruginibacter sp.]|nr:GtrA family protein [Ferruginibacter sp.]
MKILTNIIDAFYPPFKKLMPLQTFRYAACGGGNTIIGLLVFFILYRYVFVNDVIDIWFMSFKAHKAALIFSSLCTFCVGFLLNKLVVFTESNIKSHIQLFRYFLSFFANLCIAAFLQTMFIEILKMNTYFAQVLITIIIIALSYLTQKYFTFKQT